MKYINKTIEFVLETILTGIPTAITLSVFTILLKLGGYLTLSWTAIGQGFLLYVVAFILAVITAYLYGFFGSEDLES